jgi:hypothetical protein
LPDLALPDDPTLFALMVVMALVTTAATAPVSNG